MVELGIFLNNSFLFSFFLCSRNLSFQSRHFFSHFLWKTYTHWQKYKVRILSSEHKFRVAKGAFHECKYQQLNDPPYSPDLTPNDYWPFWNLTSRLHEYKAARDWFLPFQKKSTFSSFPTTFSIPSLLLTLSQTSPGFSMSAVQVFWKFCGKRRNCPLRAISPFSTVFSTHLKNFLPFWSAFKMKNKCHIGQKTLWGKDKLLLTSNSSFFSQCFPELHIFSASNLALCGNGLMTQYDASYHKRDHRSKLWIHNSILLNN